MTVAAASWGRLSLCVVLGECAWPVLEHLTQVSGLQVEKGPTSRPVVTRLDGEPHPHPQARSGLDLSHPANFHRAQ